MFYQFVKQRSEKKTGNGNLSATFQAAYCARHVGMEIENNSD